MKVLLLLSLTVFTTYSMTVSSTTSSNSKHFYPIGRLGEPWNDKEKAEWRDSREIQRSYQSEVVEKIKKLQDRYTVQQYGALSQDESRYPLFCVSTNDWKNKDKPCVLITGGVHGYETSGVQGALLFLDKHAQEWKEHFNILVFPCISPWGYETIQRWNCQAVDPNRSFNPDGEIVKGRSFNPEAVTEESAAVIQFLESMNPPVPEWLCHLDLHETTDTDDTEFRPAKASRDGVVDPPGDSIPDGFYLVSDSTKTSETEEWYKSMIDSVRKVTHIAPSDPDGTIIGELVVQEGVIAIPSPKLLGLCAGVTDAKYATTTEVYPDSPLATPEICNEAQVACIEGALRYLLKQQQK